MLDFIQNTWVSIVGAIIGLLYLYLEYKANILMWAASIVMAAFYVYIFYDAQLYASMVIYVYFFAASAYGWILWATKYKRTETTESLTIYAPKSSIVPIIGGIIVVFVIIYLILIHYTIDQNYLTIGDALTTSLNIVALWMVSRRWVEQWLLLIPANAISSALLFAQHDIMSGSLFVIFFTVSIFGYYKWKKLAVTPPKVT